MLALNSQRHGDGVYSVFSFFFFQAEVGIRDGHVTGVQTCALPISRLGRFRLEVVAVQNGPELVGRRADGLNLDLNRDYFKAEAPETRASLARVYDAWDPEIGRAPCRERSEVCVWAAAVERRRAQMR